MNFTRTTSSHSSLQHHAPRHAPIPNRMQLVWISALYLEYGYCHRLFFTTCHCLSSTIYLSLPGTYPHWKERTSSRTIRWKERASSRSRKRVSHRRIFTFMGHRSKYIRERVHAASVSVTYVRTHTRTQPTVSIDIMLNFDEVYISDILPAVSIATWYIYLYSISNSDKHKSV